MHGKHVDQHAYAQTYTPTHIHPHTHTTNSDHSLGELKALHNSLRIGENIKYKINRKHLYLENKLKVGDLGGTTMGNLDSFSLFFLVFFLTSANTLRA